MYTACRSAEQKQFSETGFIIKMLKIKFIGGLSKDYIVICNISIQASLT